jgi:hypothetical protein
MCAYKVENNGKDVDVGNQAVGSGGGGDVTRRVDEALRLGGSASRCEIRAEGGTLSVDLAERGKIVDVPCAFRCAKRWWRRLGVF